ncbi:hypothetical protein [Streptomyces sp. NPDC057302]|uniref:hypothetical protein n=1 Tax=Streptomyces sp. NPDC057302 TaxID=3346094 RepID=UPI00362664E9
MAIDADGETLFSTKVINDAAQVLALIGTVREPMQSAGSSGSGCAVGEQRKSQNVPSSRLGWGVRTLLGAALGGAGGVVTALLGATMGEDCREDADHRTPDVQARRWDGGGATLFPGRVQSVWGGDVEDVVTRLGGGRAVAVEPAQECTSFFGTCLLAEVAGVRERTACVGVGGAGVVAPVEGVAAGAHRFAGVLDAECQCGEGVCGLIGVDPVAAEFGRAVPGDGQCVLGVAFLALPVVLARFGADEVEGLVLEVGEVSTSGEERIVEIGPGLADETGGVDGDLECVVDQEMTSGVSGEVELQTVIPLLSVWPGGRLGVGEGGGEVEGRLPGGARQGCLSTRCARRSGGDRWGRSVRCPRRGSFTAYSGMRRG